MTVKVAVALPAAARAYGPALVFLAVLTLAWEGAVRALEVPVYLVPAPSRIAGAAFEVRGSLPGHVRTTLAEALAGLVLAAVGGVVLASAMASVATVRRVLYPLLVVSQNVPLVVIAPLIVLWFGFGVAPKVLVVAVVAFFPIAVNTVEGLLAADSDMLELVRSMGGSRWQALRLVRLPSALPAFFSGLKSALRMPCSAPSSASGWARAPASGSSSPARRPRSGPIASLWPWW